MTFFIFYVAYRFGHLKLGPKDAQPEFSDVSYFAMLFSAGIVSLLPFRCVHAKRFALYYIANRNLSTISPALTNNRELGYSFSAYLNPCGTRVRGQF